jgi:nucleotide-binding universal stress UspA family protein
MLKTILVPLDGSPLAERSLSLATALSIPTAAHLLLVRVSVGKAPDDDGDPFPHTCRRRPPIFGIEIFVSTRPS